VIGSPRRGIVFDLVRILVRCGFIQVHELSRKGRISLVVTGVEPMIRRKILRCKWLPPILVVVESIVTPNNALRQYFLKRVFWINRETTSQLEACFVKLVDSKLTEPIRVARAVKRYGTSWDLSPSRRVDDHWQLRIDALLRDIGVEKDKPIALVAMRYATYYEKLRRTRSEDEVGSETNPNTFIRNPDIVTYKAALERLVGLGVQPIHFGIDTPPVPHELRHLIIDYSCDFRLEESDLLLASRCLMMVTGAAGAWVLPSLFNRPVLFTNSYWYFISGPSSRDRFLPQLLWNETEGRLLTFREMVGVGGQYSYRDNCERDHIIPIKNSSSELTAAVGEMVSRIHGTFIEDESDRQLHSEFKKLMILTQPAIMSQAPIATTFLRKYSYLLS